VVPITFPRYAPLVARKTLTSLGSTDAGFVLTRPLTVLVAVAALLVEAATAVEVAVDTVAEVAVTAVAKEVRIKHQVVMALTNIPVQDTAAAVDAVCTNCLTQLLESPD
jgi:hypothetical protein